MNETTTEQPEYIYSVVMWLGPGPLVGRGVESLVIRT